MEAPYMLDPSVPITVTDNGKWERGWWDPADRLWHLEVQRGTDQPVERYTGQLFGQWTRVED